MVEEVILDWELEFLEQDEKWVMIQSIDRKPVDNEQITVIWNGEVNIANFVYNEDDNCFVCALPNGETLYAYGENTNWNYETYSRSAATVKVIAKNETVHKLDEKYLPNGGVFWLKWHRDYDTDVSVCDVTFEEVKAAYEADSIIACNFFGTIMYAGSIEMSDYSGFVDIYAIKDNKKGGRFEWAADGTCTIYGFDPV